MNDLESRIYQIGVVPVIALDDARDAAPLSDALCEGGIPAAEVTFRTSAAVETIKTMSSRHPEMCVGAGTVLTTAQVDEAVAAGARFIVSPGFDPEIVDYCISKNIEVIPGTMTPSEIAQGVKRGLRVLKFFPCEPIGGLKTLKSIAAPYNQMMFMPSGGVNAKNLPDYLAQKFIFACGGSWMVKESMINNGEFDKIRELSAEAAKIVAEYRK